MNKKKYDLVIIGAGSAGCCAALSAARVNPRSGILLVEKQAIPGGTATHGGVSNWEPGTGSAGFHLEIARRLLLSGNGCVGRSTLPLTPNRPYALSEPCADPYEKTLRRAGLKTADWRRFHFNPAALAAVLREMLAAAGNIDLLVSTEFRSAICKDRSIRSAVLNKDGQLFLVDGRFWIDASADIALARAAGCPSRIGEDPTSLYQEPSAPETTSRLINGVSLIFRMEPKSKAGIDEIPPPWNRFAMNGWTEKQFPQNRPASFVTQEPDGTLNFNMLPTLDGECYLDLGEAEAQMVCQARIYHYVQWLQRLKGLAGYRIQSIATSLGVRESYRLQAHYVLREQDVFMPFGSQPYFAEAIAFADHPLDLHGHTNMKKSVNRTGELQHPYAIPYRCLLPQDVDNLLVACRGSGFSHLAASSCRLSRTMMALGEAAGTAAALCLDAQVPAPEANIRLLRQQLSIDKLEQAVLNLSAEESGS